MNEGEGRITNIKDGYWQYLTDTYLLNEDYVFRPVPKEERVKVFLFNRNDDGTPSDRVVGITLANEADVDAFAHHACLVVFQFQEQQQTIIAPALRPDGGYATVPVAKLRDAQVKAKAFYDSLMALG